MDSGISMCPKTHKLSTSTRLMKYALTMFQTSKYTFLLFQCYADRLLVISNEHQFNFKDHDLWKLQLLDQHKVEAVHCVDEKNCGSIIHGTWSPVYDQSMTIELDNGLRFLNNFKYTIKEDISKNPLLDGASKFINFKTGDYKYFDSHCD